MDAVANTVWVAECLQHLAAYVEGSKLSQEKAVTHRLLVQSVWVGLSVRSIYCRLRHPGNCPPCPHSLPEPSAVVELSSSSSNGQPTLCVLFLGCNSLPLYPPHKTCMYLKCLFRHLTGGRRELIVSSMSLIDWLFCHPVYLVSPVQTHFVMFKDTACETVDESHQTSRVHSQVFAVSSRTSEQMLPDTQAHYYYLCM